MDYLPGPDANYQAWVANFVTYANANLAALGLVAADLTPVTAGQTGFTTGFTAHIAAKAAAQAAKQNKDDARHTLTAGKPAGSPRTSALACANSGEARRSRASAIHAADRLNRAAANAVPRTPNHGSRRNELRSAPAMPPAPPCPLPPGPEPAPLAPEPLLFPTELYRSPTKPEPGPLP